MKATSPQTVFAQLDETWRTARAGRLLPARTDLNPALAGGALRYAALLDVVQKQPLDFRYRLIGQHLIDSFGKNVTGKLHNDTFPARPIQPFCEALERCVTTGEPQEMMMGEFRNHNGTPCRVQGRAWPLSDDGTNVTGLLTGCVYMTPAHES
jgi:hypothetical protein